MIALAEQGILRGIFFSMATQEERFDLVQWITEHQEPTAWYRYSQWLLHHENLDRDARLRWAEAVLSEAGFRAIYESGAAFHLYSFLRHPLPEQKAVALLESEAWAKRLQRMDTSSRSTSWAIAGDLMHLAILMPPSARARFRADIAVFPPEYLSKALNLLNALDAIDESVA